MNSFTCSFNLVFIYLLIKEALKNKKRIDDIGDFYEISVSIDFSLLVILFRVREISLLIRKLLIQFIISFKIFFRLRL